MGVLIDSGATERPCQTISKKSLAAVDRRTTTKHCNKFQL